MRTALAIVLLVVVGGVALLWAVGGFDQLAAWAIERQRETQNQMARGLRALRGGQPGALAALLGLAFAYGFFHAAGPGHGKVLIGGYGVASQVRLWPLVLIALASSLAQATTAVALVYAGVLAFDWSRENITGVTEAWLAPISYAAIGTIGLWLVWRGARRAFRKTHGGHTHGPTCNHAHGPSAEDVAAVHGWRDAALLIGGIAIRPCTGALFLLILTWSMSIPLAGILGAYAMGLGTATITIAVAMGAVWFRSGLIGSLADSTLTRRAIPIVEVLAGLVVTLVALQLFLRAV